ncbi:WD40-repeat-containing domain protein [Fimicolochytrium jonesii]|uniref:WD40-repeat-containing domain protein n=1 Tax=Fimicolochytrium jonesii TaxID=1396493 RepID=UPI0022FDB75C|nr:WD40-repeat-containing domain protein [Fimicolochytrium jonesii]KAI8819980.1 WD40-repeat-containing domain protein [Fimicolochytrium jonesii]
MNMKSVRRAKAGPETSVLGGRTASMHSLRDALNDEGGGGGGEDWLPPKVLLKPPGQLTLTEAELNEELTRILNANNPHAPQNIARFNFREKVFKASPNVDHLVVHFEFDGFLTFKTTDETAPPAEAPTTTSTTDTSTTADGTTTTSTEAGTGTEDEKAAEEAKAKEEDDKKPKGPLRNQFNFSERAAQTINNPYRDRSTNTEPPPQRTFSDTVTQWSIFDAYMEDQQQKERAKVKAPAPTPHKSAKEEDKNLLPTETHTEDVYYKNTELRKALIVVERMANQNTFDEIAQDYKFYEDAMDDMNPGKGTLLPLWKFIHEKEKRKQVTSLGWNSRFPDFFAVGYGSYDFSRQGPGMVAGFTLKNPSYPEFLFVTESGVMSLDFHPQHHSMLAVGLYDGSVAVYSMQEQSEAPLFKSPGKGGKHTDPVWQVSWQKDDLDGNANFFSISTDGRVMQWTLLKTELAYTDVIKLKIDLQPSPTSGDVTTNDEELFGLAGGSCFDFHKKLDHLFVVGTEEGKIFKCSKEYNNQFLMSFEGHQMSVYAVRYNHFQHNIFLSASADWTVKLWDHDSNKPIMTFDLGSSVGDIAWAPYSSTVFAAATADGKVCVFDLNENKYEPICEQQVIRKAKLTHIAFNPFEPILLVGDDKGQVISFKLSPNLRKKAKQGADDEATKLKNILLIAQGQSPTD